MAHQPHFFNQQPTTNAIRDLNATDEIVIYCGAGVTIDQTGVSWSQLIAEVFRLARQLDQDVSVDDGIDYVLAHLGDPAQSASIVVDAYRDPAQSENEFLGPWLQKILYRKPAWSVGLILRNLAFYAVMAALYRRRVTIVTTNYDQHIEDKINSRTEQLESEGLATTGFRPHTITSTDVGWASVGEAGGATSGALPVAPEPGEIRVVYLHGRVGRDASVNGMIVLSEQSYAQSRERSLQVLRQYLGPAENGRSRGVLIIGASLTDGPLIDALALTADAALESTLIRVALTDMRLPAPAGHTSPSITDVRQALAYRGRHLGIRNLWPENHAQSAQFLEELRVALELTKAATPRTKVMSYTERARRWGAAYRADSAASAADTVYERLTALNETVRQTLLDAGHDPAEETTRVELWVHTNPDSDDIVMVGTSAGPIYDAATYRRESLKRLDNASGLALREGRPIMRDLTELGALPIQASRWRTFFSVPIYVRVGHATVDAAGVVPVGVISLTSTASRLESDRAKASALQVAESTTLIKIRDDMIGLGRSLLSPDGIGPTVPAVPAVAADGAANVDTSARSTG